MRVAVLSDIHSNYHAFKACYEDAVKCGADRFIFLGDYVSDLAEPWRTMDLVYEIQSCYPTVCLRGNREGYMLDCEKGSSSFARGSKSGSLLFTYDHLRKKDLDFFRELEISDTIEIDGVRIEIAHATIDNDRYYFDCNDGRTAEIFPQMKCKYLLTGHSHKQYILRDSDKTIINPGSVGIPQDGTPWPKYAILEIANGDISYVFREVSYNMADAIHSQFANGLVDYAKYWAIGILYDIITGEEWVLKLLKHVQEAGGIYDEEVWHSTAARMGMKFTEQEILAIYRSIRLDGLDFLPESSPKAVRHFVRHIQSPAVNIVFLDPMLCDSNKEFFRSRTGGVELRHVLAHTEILVVSKRGIRLIAIDQEPIVIGGCLSFLKHILELHQILTAMVEHRIQNHTNAVLMANLHQFSEGFICSKLFVYLVVIGNVVFMIGYGSENRGQIQCIHTQRFDVSDFFDDAGKIATCKALGIWNLVPCHVHIGGIGLP